MKCGECKHCKPNDVCSGNCLCDAPGMEASADGGTSFYGKIDNEPCGMFTAKDAVYYFDRETKELLFSF